jgi:hypothetical protein
MQKIWKVSFLGACAGLLLTTAWLLTYPTPAFAAYGTADCGNGLVATCSAYRCNCIDGIGCTAIDERGNIIGRTPCIANKGSDMPIPEGPVVAE